MVLSIDEVNDILDRVYDEFPEALFQELNGGVLLLEDALPDPDAGEDVYIMGEYCVDGLGRYINIYYGSFAALLFDEPRRVWEEELRTTLRHELTHHVEGWRGSGAWNTRTPPSWTPCAGGRTGRRKASNQIRKDETDMETIQYTPRGVCSKKMEIDVEGGVIQAVRVMGGCSGNLQGICSLLKGMTVEEAVGRMEGIRCGMKPTSCPDQLAQALKAAR